MSSCSQSQSKDNSKDKGLVESGFHNSPENSSLGSGSVGESDGHTDSNFNKKSEYHMTMSHDVLDNVQCVIESGRLCFVWRVPS